MKSFDYYREVGVAYPNRDDFKTVYVYQKGVVLVDGIKLTAMPPADLVLHKEEGHLVEESFDRPAYQAACDVYRAAESAKYLEFRRDLFEEFDVSDNPKANTLFNKCWERGHSGGYNDVYSIFSDFVDIIKD